MDFAIDYNWTFFIYLSELHSFFVSGDFCSPPGPLIQDTRKAIGCFSFPVSDKYTARRDTNVS